MHTKTCAVPCLGLGTLGERISLVHMDPTRCLCGQESAHSNNLVELQRLSEQHLRDCTDLLNKYQKHSVCAAAVIVKKASFIHRG